jgi:anaerobic selenocysteine-containing dehydrogenase
MHVLIRDELLDHDYIARHTLGFDALRQRALAYPPERVAAICGISTTEVEQTRARVRQHPTGGDSHQLRHQPHRRRRHGAAHGGLPAGAHRCLARPAGGVLLSSSGNYPVDSAALERPDLMPTPTPRTINMSTIGHDLLRAQPPIKALFVYNSNPVAVAPQAGEVVRGFARDDLFTVVHDLFQTDTADYADILLPATSHMEQLDIHKSYGHLHLQVNQPAIAPLGEACRTPNCSAAWPADGFQRSVFCRQRRRPLPPGLRLERSAPRRMSWEKLKADGHARLNLPRGQAPFADGGFPTPSGKCEFYSQMLAERRLDPCPTSSPRANGGRVRWPASFRWP